MELKRIREPDGIHCVYCGAQIDWESETCCEACHEISVNHFAKAYYNESTRTARSRQERHDDRKGV